jgi:transcriptional regulator with PAS, ATPase and Fis domain
MSHEVYPQLIGASHDITELREQIARVACSDARVLITGESGSGKELVAKAIARSRSDVRPRPFVVVNCAGISERLLELELFGQASGPTGDEQPGKLELANNGVLFLDEIGELSLRMQSQLLRFFETGEIQRVGAERAATVSKVRVLAATNRDLWKLIAEGRFREDFFYRIDVIHVAVPPLRARREDIPLLVDHFLKRFTADSFPYARLDSGNDRERSRNGVHTMKKAAGSPPSPVRGVTPDAMAAFCTYSWPGNVRQLENVVERLVVTGRRELVALDGLPPEIQTAADSRFTHDSTLAMTDDLFKKLVNGRESFWTAVYPLYMSREITRGQVRDLVRKGLEEARGNYRIVLRLFNMESSDYKRFLGFLRKHNCQLPFKEYR